VLATVPVCRIELDVVWVTPAVRWRTPLGTVVTDEAVVCVALSVVSVLVSGDSIDVGAVSGATLAPTIDVSVGADRDTVAVGDDAVGAVVATPTDVVGVDVVLERAVLGAAVVPVSALMSIDSICMGTEEAEVSVPRVGVVGMVFASIGAESGAVVVFAPAIVNPVVALVVVVVAVLCRLPVASVDPPSAMIDVPVASV